MSALLLAEVGSLQKTINTYLRGDDAVRIFNRNLSADEVSKLANSTGI